MAIFKTSKSIGELKPRTTVSGSAKIRNWSEEIKKAALFSARTTRKTYLDELMKRLQAVASRDEVPAVAIHKLKATLGEMGYTPQAGFPGDLKKWHGATIPPAKPGSITDLSSQRRINLIIDTNIKQAQSMGQISTSDNPVFLMANPAWELTRIGSRKKPRQDWKDRWRLAGESVNWKGALKGKLVALKDSPIWEALGEGKGGYKDTLGSDYPPYAFGSGMGWVNVGRRSWKSMCEEEGVPDQLESIVEKARALKRAQEAAGGQGAYGASADADWKQKQREEAAMRVDEPPKPVFHPNTEAMDAVREAFAGVRDKVKGIAEKMAAAKGRVKVVADYIGGLAAKYPAVDLGESMLAIGGVQADVDKWQTRMTAVGGDAVAGARDADAVPVPADDNGQAEFDLRAKELNDRAAELVADIEAAGVVEKNVDKRVADARKMADDAVMEWRKAECQKIVDEAKAAIDALADDGFEELKKKFAEVKKEAKRAGRI